MAQTSTKRRNIIIVSVVIAVLAVSSIAALIISYHQPSTAKHTPTQLKLSVSLNQTSVLQGGSLEADVNVTSIGNAENVTLDSDAGSSGIRCSFEPATGTSNFTSFLTMSVPGSTPTSNYSVTVTASGGGEIENTSYIISVLCANVTVSGNVNISALAAVGVSSLTRIQFTDTQTNSTIAYVFPSVYPPVATSDYGTYSVTLQNEQTYKVTLNYYWGMIGASLPELTYDAGNFYAFAPAGSTSISQNFSLS